MNGGGANNQKNAMVASPDTVADPMWYPDSGATNHCTPDSSHLMNKMDYQGKDKIYVGNGTGLAISSIGSNTFDAEYC